MLSALRASWGDPELEFDERLNGVPLAFGSAHVVVSVEERPLRLCLVSRLAANVHETEAVLSRLNRLNATVVFGRAYWRDGGIYAQVDLPAMPFHTPTLIHACAALGSKADELDEALQAEFGFRTGRGGFRPMRKVH